MGGLWRADGDRAAVYDAYSNLPHVPPQQAAGHHDGGGEFHLRWTAHHHRGDLRGNGSGVGPRRGNRAAARDQKLV